MDQPNFMPPSPFTPKEAEVNDLTRTRLELEASGNTYLDLTVTNPTLAEFDYAAMAVENWNGRGHLFPYHPRPMGEWESREAVAQYLREQGQTYARPNRIGLTSSTSEAYAFLFRILAGPGDEVIIMTPGYPLCDELLAWARLKPLAWPWKRAPDQNGFSTWTTDWKSLEWSLTNRTKAIVLIHPNNPTGYGLTDEDFQKAYALALRHGLAVIVDTVFFDYSILSSPKPLFPVPKSHGAKVITLGGLSKTCALPQMKMGWAYFDGPTETVEPIMTEWERWADTFLSVSTPVQRLTSELLRNRAAIQHEIRQRCQTNLDCAIQFQNETIRVDIPQAGWALPLCLPHLEDDEAFCVGLLQKAGVLVQPGYFFDYPDNHHLVLSLITPPQRFRRGLEKLVQYTQQP